MRSTLRSLLNKRSLPSKRKQKGAVAIVFGLSIVTLFAMGGVVLDLGHMYIVTSELQNSADAAALAGARRLNESATGITNARDDAIALAAQNNFNFSTAVVIGTTNIEYGSSPSGPFVNYATAFASPAGKTFVRVDTGSRAINTYLMRVVSSAYNTVSTQGVAVAGRFVNNVTPIGVCAIKDAGGASRSKGEALPTGELAQFGFRRGVSYNIFNLNPLGGPSDSYLINAVDVHPNPCGPNNTNPNITAPFVCNGSSAVITTTPGTVYGNVGVEAGKIQDALNSRFNLYPTGNPVCISAQAPPDINIKKYGCTDVPGPGPSTCTTPVADWMAPTKQSLFESTGIPTATEPIPLGIASKHNYGVLWTYSRAVSAVGTSPATPGTAFATTDWTTLYPAPGGTAPAADADFPATVSPYLDITNSSHFLAPTGNAGVANRRVLNLVIADCPEIEDSTTCTNAKNIPVLGIGRFFMQVPADFSASPKKLEVEFAGLIEPVPVSEIKLYR